ncbi:MAG: helix-turn-helix domain-containing protein, partial [Promethearchaeota archaeon]
MVRESADIGHFAGLKYGIKNRKYKNRVQQIWESISPLIDYGAYRYNPPIGFPLFDNVVDGYFLQKVIPWLNTFADVTAPMTSATFTSALERWMFNYNRLLKPIELKVLQGLNNLLHLSQIELAEHLGLHQPTVSRILQMLAEKHLLRFFNIVNLPIIGLQPISIEFHTQSLRQNFSLLKILSGIRYAEAIQEFNKIIKAEFAIPFKRTRRFRQWVKQLAGVCGLSLPNTRLMVERVHSRNFSLYNPREGGWPLNYETILDNISKLIREEWTEHLPPLRSCIFPTVPSSLKIELQPEDFVFLQRSTDVYLLTGSTRSSKAFEARLAGFRESEHMVYRRRVEFLEEKEVISQPIGVGLIHIGLDAVVNVIIRGT